MDRDTERKETMPLGGDSKISVEDLPLWIEDSNIKNGGSKENLEMWKPSLWLFACKY